MKEKDFNTFIREVIQMAYTQIIKEGISQVVWHFCPISSMYIIARDNQFKCSSIETNISDRRLTTLPINKKTGEGKMYPYYMCVSRTPYSGVGYQQMRRKGGSVDWRMCLVRIELDGNALNARFKGMPVNYFNNDPSVNNKKISHGGELLPDKNDPTKFHLNQKNRWIDVQSITGGKRLKDKQLRYGKGIPGPEKDKIDKRQMLEYEDRLYSNNEYINNFDRYIVRIDILCTPQILGGRGEQSGDILGEIKYVNQRFNGKVFLYDSETAFNSRNIRQSININNRKYSTIPNQTELLNSVNDYNPSVLTKNEARVLGNYAGYIVSGNKDSFSLLNYFVNKLNINQMPNEIKQIFLLSANKTIEKILSSENFTYLMKLTLSLGKDLQMINAGKQKYKDILDFFQQKDEEYLKRVFANKPGSSYNTLKKYYILQQRYAKAI